MVVETKYVEIGSNGGTRRPGHAARTVINWTATASTIPMRKNEPASGGNSDLFNCTSERDHSDRVRFQGAARRQSRPDGFQQRTEL
jgi:hypothetical protein